MNQIRIRICHDIDEPQRKCMKTKNKSCVLLRSMPVIGGLRVLVFDISGSLTGHLLGYSTPESV